MRNFPLDPCRRDLRQHHGGTDVYADTPALPAADAASVGRVWYAHYMSNPIIPRMSPEALRATQERRRSGAAGTHRNKGDRRARTRSAAKRRAVKEYA
jgi:hypothetical protein